LYAILGLFVFKLKNISTLYNISKKDLANF